MILWLYPTLSSILKIKTLPHPRSESPAVDLLRPRPRRAKSPPNQRVPGAAARQKDHQALLHRKGTHILLSLPGTHLLSRTSLKRKIGMATKIFCSLSQWPLRILVFKTVLKNSTSKVNFLINLICIHSYPQCSFQICRNFTPIQYWSH